MSWTMHLLRRPRIAILLFQFAEPFQNLLRQDTFEGITSVTTRLESSHQRIGKHVLIVRCTSWVGARTCLASQLPQIISMDMASSLAQELTQVALSCQRSVRITQRTRVLHLKMEIPRLLTQQRSVLKERRTMLVGAARRLGLPFFPLSSIHTEKQLPLSIENSFRKGTALLCVVPLRLCETGAF